MTTDHTPIETRPHLGGTQRLYRFANGRGASVVSSPLIYGGEAGLAELAVLVYDGNRSHLDYSTPITDDVIGWLTEERVAELLAQIAALPPATPADSAAAQKHREDARQNLTRLAQELRQSRQE